MSSVIQTVLSRSCRVYLACLVVISAVTLSPEAIPTPRQARRSHRSVTACIADSSVRLVQCGNADGCILVVFRCDGVIECDDGSDESEATCTGGMACNESLAPACPSHSTCRSVPASDTRLAHRVCDCAAPFTGSNCTEMTTTTVPLADNGVATNATVTSGPRAPTTTSTTGDTFSTDAVKSFTQASELEIDTTPSPVGSWTTTDRTSSIKDTRTVATSTQPMATVTDQKGNHFLTPLQSDPVTQNDATTAISDASKAETNTVSTLPPAESTHRSTVENAPPVRAGQTDSSTGPTPRGTTVVPKLGTTAQVDRRGHATQPVHSLIPTPHSNRPPANGSGDLRNKDPGTTPILVVVFGLITLIPMAIFFHCRLKRGGCKMLTPKAKKDDKTESHDTPDNSKPNHQRNSSTSSIQLKENSTLLGNELPLDVNMNAPPPTPPVILITPPPDVTSESPLETQRDKKKQRHRKQQKLPDTQLWFPDDGETPFFVTDNVPLPVSLV